MSLPELARIFFAIDLSASEKEAVGRLIGEMKKRAKTHSIRWTKIFNLHLTLQFLKAVNRHDLPAMLENVRRELVGKMKGSSVNFGEIKVFPNLFMPRVIVIDIDPPHELAELAKAIGVGIQASNYAIESRPFVPHLTLGRIKHTDIDLKFLAAFNTNELPAITIKEVTLFHSEPQPDGSKYTVIERLS